MKKTGSVRILCALVALLLVCALTAGCGTTIVVRIPQLENLSQPDAGNNVIPVYVGQPNAQTPAQNAAEPVRTQEPADADTPTGETPQGEQPAPDKPDGLSKEEIVDLYNTAVNKVKKEATKLTRNYKHVSIPEDQLELPKAIQGLGKTAIGTFVKGSDTPESWTAREDMQLVFPVGNTDYSSRLTPAMVESAACTEDGGVYQIRLKLYDDAITSPEKGQGYAGVFNTITASTFRASASPPSRSSAWT